MGAKNEKFQKKKSVFRTEMRSLRKESVLIFKKCEGKVEF